MSAPAFPLQFLRLTVFPGLANVFPFWNGQFTQNATAALFEETISALSHIQTISGSADKIHFMVGESGWPTDGGGDYYSSVASTENAQLYFTHSVCTLLDAGFDVFYFEAFDEPTKPAVNKTGGSGPLSEAVWGGMDVNRIPKLNLTCL